MSRNPKLNRAGEQIASLHEMDRRLRAKAVQARRAEKEVAALESEARRARLQRAGVNPNLLER